MSSHNGKIDTAAKLEMKRYRNIFIDLDDTLYDFSAASRESFKETYDNLGYSRFFESFRQYMDIYTPYNLELWTKYGKGEITKAQLNKERFGHPLKVVGAYDEALAAQFEKESLQLIPTKNKLIPYAKEILEYLYPKYNLYILSNGFQELQEKKMKTSGIRDYFKALILSDHIGINKPRRELFEHALSIAESEIEESIMIGDMFETDIAGAHNIGMDQIFVNLKGVKEKAFTPTYEVSHLKEIENIL